MAQRPNNMADHPIVRRLLTAATLLLVLLPQLLSSQNVPGDTVRPTILPLYRWAIAAPHAPRIGASFAPIDDRVRLDIGGTIPLWRPVDPSVDDTPSVPNAELGADFFTWSSLRSERDFKFPVEGVDYYFGFYGALDLDLFDEPLFGSDRTRLIPTARVAHISAHLVDGDTLFRIGAEPFVYSREFVDLDLAVELTRSNRPTLDGWFRTTIGFRYLFHTIPVGLSRFSPALSLDGAIAPSMVLPITLEAGYHLRLDQERESILEHRARLGLKAAGLYESGLLFEIGYHNGRSVYGQYFPRREEGWSLGFRVVM